MTAPRALPVTTQNELRAWGFEYAFRSGVHCIRPVGRDHWTRYRTARALLSRCLNRTATQRRPTDYDLDRRPPCLSAPSESGSRQRGGSSKPGIAKPGAGLRRACVERGYHGLRWIKQGCDALGWEWRVLSVLDADGHEWRAVVHPCCGADEIRAGEGDAEFTRGPWPWPDRRAT